LELEHSPVYFRVPRIIGIHWQSNDIKNAAPEAAHDAQAHPYLI